MSANPDPRLDEIQARLDKANAEMDRLTERNPGSAWRWSIPANPERDSDLILSASMADASFLLAELRKARERARRVAAVATRYRDERNEAHEALARVEAECRYLDTLADGDRYYAKVIRAAVAAAKETE